jgi:DNA-directed RNA polymerase specialized sigma24 family protein
LASWRQVFEELVRERRAGLVGYATLLAGNADDGEDLVHDAIIRSFGRARAFTHVNAAEAYVRQAISSAFIDGTRKARTARAAMPALVIRDPASIAHSGGAPLSQEEFRLGPGLVAYRTPASGSWVVWLNSALEGARQWN